MSASQIPTGVTIIQSLSGFQAVSLTEFTTSAAPSIAAGSKVEIAGAFFQFVSDDAINASSWTAITTGTTAYIQLTPSGTAGSQIATASYTATAPTWRDDLQGWYASAASSSRVVASVYKNEATSYQAKIILEYIQKDYTSGQMIFISSGTFIVPTNVSKVWLTGCAAGGNGYAGTVGYPGGGGGGGGEIIWKKPITVTPGASISVTIGAVGSNTSFGTVTLNCGVSATSGAGGAGGALSGGSVAGAAGGSGTLSASTVSTIGASSSFSGGGGTPSNGGGGGGGGLGLFGYYAIATAGGTAYYTGGSAGSFGGGGGGGSTSSGSAAGAGGNGGYGSGGGGGGYGTGGGSSGGSGGNGGAAVLIVEW